ncbi:hypothetical protein G7046_g3634 [Stylonectria norvegica]|nr:hypothetical protein G7046_g3634 [Stylonectria norvegica]
MPETVFFNNFATPSPPVPHPASYPSLCDLSNSPSPPLLLTISFRLQHSWLVLSGPSHLSERSRPLISVPPISRWRPAPLWIWNIRTSRSASMIQSGNAAPGAMNCRRVAMQALLGCWGQEGDLWMAFHGAFASVIRPWLAQSAVVVDEASYPQLRSMGQVSATFSTSHCQHETVSHEAQATRRPEANGAGANQKGPEVLGVLGADAANGVPRQLWSGAAPGLLCHWRTAETAPDYGSSPPLLASGSGPRFSTLVPTGFVSHHPCANLVRLLHRWRASKVAGPCAWPRLLCSYTDSICRRVKTGALAIDGSALSFWCAPPLLVLIIKLRLEASEGGLRLEAGGLTPAPAANPPPLRSSLLSILLLFHLARSPLGSSPFINFQSVTVSSLLIPSRYFTQGTLDYYLRYSAGNHPPLVQTLVWACPSKAFPASFCNLQVINYRQSTLELSSPTPILLSQQRSASVTSRAFSLCTGNQASVVDTDFAVLVPRPTLSIILSRNSYLTVDRAVPPVSQSSNGFEIGPQASPSASYLRQLGTRLRHLGMSLNDARFLGDSSGIELRHGDYYAGEDIGDTADSILDSTTYSEAMDNQFSNNSGMSMSMWDLSLGKMPGFFDDDALGATNYGAVTNSEHFDVANMSAIADGMRESTVTESSQSQQQTSRTSSKSSDPSVTSASSMSKSDSNKKPRNTKVSRKRQRKQKPESSVPMPAPPPPTQVTPPAREVPQNRANAAMQEPSPSSPVEEGPRRYQFLERNRIAASKCRKKKKEWVSDLEETKYWLEQQHTNLQREYNGLVNEVSQMKNHLMAHASCNDPNIDGWLEMEARKFIQKSTARLNTKPNNKSRNDSFAQSRRDSAVAQTSPSTQFAHSQLASPESRTDGINYDHMPDGLFNNFGEDEDMRGDMREGMNMSDQ